MKGVKTMTYTDQEKTVIVAQSQQGISAQKLSVEYGVNVLSIAGQKSIAT